jgi:hypothetical protein
MGKRNAATAAIANDAPAGTPAPASSIGEWVPMHQLRPWKGNPQKSDATVLMPSIEKLGWGRPIVANRYPGLEGEIIIGHHALEAARMLEASGVVIPRAVPGHAPVAWVSLPAKQAHAMAVADNQLGRKGELDDDAFAAFVRTGELDPEQWLAAGFEEKQIKALMFEAWPQPDTKRTRNQRGKLLAYSVIIECESEEQQTELMERFEGEGLRCKPWVG